MGWPGHERPWAVGAGRRVFEDLHEEVLELFGEAQEKGASYQWDYKELSFRGRSEWGKDVQRVRKEPQRRPRRAVEVRRQRWEVTLSPTPPRRRTTEWLAPGGVRSVPCPRGCGRIVEQREGCKNVVTHVCKPKEMAA